MKAFRPLWVLLMVAVLAASTAGADSRIPLWKEQTIYVPVYSHIFSGDRSHPFNLSATLCVRNTDPRRSITVTTVKYYDSEGKEVHDYLPEPLKLAPLASVHYYVKESDTAGGFGANFIVRWEAEEEVNAPLVETVMISTRSQQGISFTTRGQVLGGE